MFSNGDYIGSGNLGDGDIMLVGSIQVDVAGRQLRVLQGRVDVLGSNTGGDCKLELLCLFKEISSEVSRVERSGDEDLGLSRQLGSFASFAPDVDSRRGSPSGRLIQIPPCRQ